VLLAVSRFLPFAPSDSLRLAPQLSALISLLFCDFGLGTCVIAVICSVTTAFSRLLEAAVPLEIGNIGSLDLMIPEKAFSLRWR
jgi:hypothetical protein